MEFELFAAPKNKEYFNLGLPTLLSEFNLVAVEGSPVVWIFQSEDLLALLFQKIDSLIGENFDFGLIALDGSENNLAPNQADSNKPYLEFCLRRSRNGLEGDLSPIRSHFERHLQRVEEQLRQNRG